MRFLPRFGRFVNRPYKIEDQRGQTERGRGRREDDILPYGWGWYNERRRGEGAEMRKRLLLREKVAAEG